MLTLEEQASQTSVMINAEAAQSKMLAKTFGEILDMLRRDRAVTIEERSTVLSFAAIYEWEHYAEIGSLVSHPAYRERGYGIKVVQRAIVLARREIPKPIIALANDLSRHLFERSGFHYRDKRNADSELWLPCPLGCLEYGHWPNCHCHFMTLD